MRIKNVLDKWQFVFSVGRDPRTLERGWKLVEFGILKFHSFPHAGDWFGPEHYKGFFTRFVVWLPFDRAY